MGKQKGVLNIDELLGNRGLLDINVVKGSDLNSNLKQSFVGPGDYTDILIVARKK